MSPVVLLGGLALGGLIYVAARGRNRVTVNGRTWILEEQSGGGEGSRSVIVFSPPRQFGPHGKMPVFMFVEVLNDDGGWQRNVLHRYPGVPAAVDAAAMKDLSVGDMQ